MAFDLSMLDLLQDKKLRVWHFPAAGRDFNPVASAVISVSAPGREHAGQITTLLNYTWLKDWPRMTTDWNVYISCNDVAIGLPNFDPYT